MRKLVLCGLLALFAAGSLAPSADAARRRRGRVVKVKVIRRGR